VVFQVDGQRYGLPAADVEEVQRAVTVVPLPKGPAVVEGIINLRGAVVPVLGMRTRLGRPAKPLEPSDHLLVARESDRRVALRVDRVLDLVRLDATAVEEARGVVPGAEYVSWLAKVPDDLVLILDLRSFLSRKESEELTEALRGAAPSSPAR
jgi:purine-binding chemotaxis protein CheW